MKESDDVLYTGRKKRAIDQELNLPVGQSLVVMNRVELDRGTRGMKFYTPCFPPRLRCLGARVGVRWVCETFAILRGKMKNKKKKKKKKTGAEDPETNASALGLIWRDADRRLICQPGALKTSRQGLRVPVRRPFDSRTMNFAPG